MGRLDKLRIPLDEHRFENVGRLPDGTQFMAFVTGAFPTGLKYYLEDDWQYKKKWLAVVHRFDADGNHTGSESRLGGFDIEGRQVAGDKALVYLDEMYAELCAGAQPNYCDIWVRLFAVEIDGVTHGLFYEQSEEQPEPGEEREEWVMLEPTWRAQAKPRCIGDELPPDQEENTDPASRADRAAVAGLLEKLGASRASPGSHPPASARQALAT